MRLTDDQRRAIRSDFVNRRMAATTIAAARGCSVSTVQRLKARSKADGDDWESARRANVVAGEGVETVVSMVVEDFVLTAHSMMDQIKTEETDFKARMALMVQLADATTKMTSAARKLAPTISELGVAQAVLEDMLGFVRAEFPQHAEAILEIIEPFGETLTTRFQQ